MFGGVNKVPSSKLDRQKQRSIVNFNRRFFRYCWVFFFFFALRKNRHRADITVCGILFGWLWCFFSLLLFYDVHMADT